MTAAAILLLSVCSLPQLTLEEGHRWTYARDGREAMVVDVLDGHRRIGGVDCKTLRVRGGNFFWHATSDVHVTAGEDGLVEHGYVYSDTLLGEDEPAKQLLPAELRIGDSWRSGDFRAEVVAREKVRVPAGEFDAFEIEYVLGDHLGTESDLRVWVAPGIGVVRISEWRESTRGARTEVVPIHYELTRSLVPRRHDFGVPVLEPQHVRGVRNLIARLAAGGAPDANAIGGRLHAFGRGALPLLLEAARDAELGDAGRARVRAVVDRFARLELRASASPTVRRGESPELRFSIRNVWAEPLHFLPSLDGSDCAMRYPRYSIEVRDADGAEVELPAIIRCGNTNALRVRNFVELQPGEAFDPFGPGSFGHQLLAWRPAEPGEYRVRLTIDCGGKIPDAWHDELSLGPRDAQAFAMLAAMPRGKLVSNDVVISVR